MYAARKLFYFARMAVYRQLGILRFFSKPGSRIIIPIALIGVVFLLRPDLHQLLKILAWNLDHSFRPDWLLLDIVLALLLVPLIYGYIVSSKVLAVLLGAFPVAARPLPPVRRLKEVKQDIRPAVVRVVVPSLPRQRQARGAH